MNEQDEARLVRLEELVAHQQAAIEDLSRQLTDSWRQAEKLGRELARLTDRFQDIEDTAGGPAANQRPPHW
ncbi:MAG: SlyX family protein [Hoeflea sp.]|uniref:SlyX family protein n=1 Tax=Hoeflea sp. TaxID=1940281 RepID=UPI001D9D22C7|nr:SlyX family protein [Hoeflea sp.]MBU4531660.1 SlyX family protein [Alphaproteobacteria bacterium]MBU4544517.1 SlyX family protein [Alphaproteobacteria bacterium]MBU4552748.1 SlyX family protein [Alphaproteobacteria bacterium]MBV1724936.1 SlyX family protein [Hoeflea sp.]MBV1760956.1 SlyX family protein [Hoeflea sp.]